MHMYARTHRALPFSRNLPNHHTYTFTHTQSPALPHLTRLVVWDEDETLDADAVAALQGANPRVHVTVHARLVPTPAL